MPGACFQGTSLPPTSSINQTALNQLERVLEKQKTSVRRRRVCSVSPTPARSRTWRALKLFTVLRMPCQDGSSLGASRIPIPKAKEVSLISSRQPLHRLLNLCISSLGTRNRLNSLESPPPSSLGQGRSLPNQASSLCPQPQH